eukprot:TRINITY_DN8271_c0_g1_i1.p1 TRINITY_DN8271_c0_g1~~TRINITY_DN8271_c0_g1_i1.p1  ORF type:complete len:869 (-),score=192.76 TRINITY_DN8271_c0_g1_i1:32-2374(-)
MAHSLIKAINLLRNINHPNVLSFKGFYLQDKRAYIVLEYCEAGSITEIYEDQQHPLSEPQIVLLCYSLLKAVDYLHKNKVIHRNIKGKNVLVTRNGDIKLNTFRSCAPIVDGGRKSFAGTPYWVAPEVAGTYGYWNDDESFYDEKIDIWSIGITAIECCQCDPPLHDLDPDHALCMIYVAPPPSLVPDGPFSPSFVDFVNSCLLKDPTQRPSAESLLNHPIFNDVDFDAIKAVASVVDTWDDWTWEEDVDDPSMENLQKFEDFNFTSSSLEEESHSPRFEHSDHLVYGTNSNGALSSSMENFTKYPRHNRTRSTSPSRKPRRKNKTQLYTPDNSFPLNDIKENPSVYKKRIRPRSTTFESTQDRYEVYMEAYKKSKAKKRRSLGKTRRSSKKKRKAEEPRSLNVKKATKRDKRRQKRREKLKQEENLFWNNSVGTAVEKSKNWKTSLSKLKFIQKNHNKEIRELENSYDANYIQDLKEQGQLMKAIKKSQENNLQSQSKLAMLQEEQLNRAHQQELEELKKAYNLCNKNEQVRLRYHENEKNKKLKYLEELRLLGIDMREKEYTLNKQNLLIVFHESFNRALIRRNFESNYFQEKIDMVKDHAKEKKEIHANQIKKFKIKNEKKLKKKDGFQILKSQLDDQLKVAEHEFQSFLKRQTNTIVLQLKEQDRRNELEYISLMHSKYQCHNRSLLELEKKNKMGLVDHNYNMNAKKIDVIYEYSLETISGEETKMASMKEIEEKKLNDKEKINLDYIERLKVVEENELCCRAIAEEYELFISET